MSLVKKSKFLSLILRHDPGAAGIVLDKNGWTDVGILLEAADLSMEELKDIVENNNKKRFEFNIDCSRIRARQGHSVQVDVELEKKTPPRSLYHGTKSKVFPAIKKHGLKKMKRLHVHLSKDEWTAKDVADRRGGSSVIIQVDALRMHNDGHDFFLSNNGVWLTDNVPPDYLMSFSWPE